MHIELLHREHDRSQFDCAEASLNNYLRTLANQQGEKYLGRTFVATAAPGDSRIVGFYTLAMADIDALIVPNKLGLSSIPVVLLGRLAVDRNFHGKGVGAELLVDALARAQRIARTEIGAYAVVVDALHHTARSFYEHFGFTPLLDNPLHLFLTMRKIEKLGLNVTN